jgi:hypothetical protein
VHVINNKNLGALGEDFMPIGPIAKNDSSALDVVAQALFRFAPCRRPQQFDTGQVTAIIRGEPEAGNPDDA